MLPQVLPMLAVVAEPFDSLEYCFEVKYDGVRALAAVDEMGSRLWGRERADYTARFPELDVLRRLPTGTLVTASWLHSTRTVGLICDGCYVGMGWPTRGGFGRRGSGVRCGMYCSICCIIAGVA